MSLRCCLTLREHPTQVAENLGPALFASPLSPDDDYFQLYLVFIGLQSEGLEDIASDVGALVPGTTPHDRKLVELR